MKRVVSHEAMVESSKLLLGKKVLTNYGKKIASKIETNYLKLLFSDPPAEQ